MYEFFYTKDVNFEDCVVELVIPPVLFLRRRGKNKNKYRT